MSTRVKKKMDPQIKNEMVSANEKDHWVRRYEWDEQVVSLLSTSWKTNSGGGCGGGGQKGELPDEDVVFMDAI